MRLAYIYFFCFISLISCNNTYQDAVLYVKTSVYPVNTYIGDDLTYEVSIISKKDLDYNFTDIAFDEREDISRIISTENRIKDKGNYKERIIKYTIAFYDSGQFAISPFNINYNRNGEEINIYGESINIIVYPFSDGDTLPPMQGSIPLKMPYYVWIIVAAFSIFIVFLICLILYIKRRSKNRVENKVVEREDKEALLSLNSIDYNKYYKETRYAEYYFNITYIFRKYLTRRYSHNLIDMTTSDIEKFFMNKSIDGKHDILIFLQGADYIKFAKRIPSLEDMKKDFNFCIDYIKRNGSLLDILKKENKEKNK